MFKSIKWRDVILAIVTCLAGLLGVDKGVEMYYSEDERIDEPVGYFQVIAQFCIDRPLNVANFTDTYVDGILVEYYEFKQKPTEALLLKRLYLDYPLLKNAKFCGYLRYDEPTKDNTKQLE